jgi:hypothetical protein
MELIDLILVLLAIFGVFCVVSALLAIALDRAQEWALDVEDTQLWH